MSIKKEAGIHGVQGIHLVTALGFEKDSLELRGCGGTSILELPFSEMTTTNVYRQNEVELQFFYDEGREMDGVILTDLRLLVPPVEVNNSEALNDAIHLAEDIAKSIKKKIGLGKMAGDLLVTLEDLPMTVPRGKYSLDLYSRQFRMHGPTFNYTVEYKNVKKAFLLPMNDEVRQ